MRIVPAPTYSGINDGMMNVSLSSFTFGPIDLAPGVPRDMELLVLPGSKALSATGVYGKILLQQINTGHFTILHTVYRIQRNFAMEFSISAPFLIAHVALQTDSHYHIEDMGEVRVKAGQFTMMRAPSIDGTYFFEEGKEYHSLNFYFPQEILDMFLPLLPSLAIKEEERDRPLFLLSQPGWVNAYMTEIIDALLKAPQRDPSVRNLFLDANIKELLSVMLMQEYRNTLLQPGVTKRQMEAANDARNYIEGHIDRHFTIGQLAKHAGVSKSTLKSAFKAVFNTSVSDFVLDTKMKKAWRLVLETDKPNKEIAKLTGYTSAQNFLTAFRKYFKATPFSLRKKTQ